MEAAKKLTLIILLIGVIGATSTFAPIAFTGGKKLTISTTTSLYETELLTAIRNQFRNKYGIDLHFIPVGSGQAIELAKRGDVDAVMVHAPTLEREAMREGALVLRKVFAYNFFIIVGPKEDPANIKGLPPLEAFRKIAEVAEEKGSVRWLSRGDNSGTHNRELMLWKSAGFDINLVRKKPWYIESGSGMGDTLKIADERRAYTLSDIGTYLRYFKEGLIDLRVLVSGGKLLINIYSIMATSPKIRSNVPLDDVVKLIKFLISDEGQELISSYKKEEYGQPLFYSALRELAKGESEVARWIKDVGFFNGDECPPEWGCRIPQYSELYSKG